VAFASLEFAASLRESRFRRERQHFGLAQVSLLAGSRLDSESIGELDIRPTSFVGSDRASREADLP
jgi:hypothetical protein